MLKTNNNIDFKTVNKNLKKELQKLGLDISNSASLNLLSRALGCENFNLYNAIYLKNEDIMSNKEIEKMIDSLPIETPNDVLSEIYKNSYYDKLIPILDKEINELTNNKPRRNRIDFIEKVLISTKPDPEDLPIDPSLTKEQLRLDKVIVKALKERWTDFRELKLDGYSLKEISQFFHSQDIDIPPYTIYRVWNELEKYTLKHYEQYNSIYKVYAKSDEFNSSRKETADEINAFLNDESYLPLFFEDYNNNIKENKRKQLLKEWKVVISLRKKGWSFGNIKLYLLKAYNIDIHHYQIYETWKELEEQKV